MIPKIAILIIQGMLIYLFAALGEAIDELSGILNVGLEGMMLSGALTAVIVGSTFQDPWIGILAGIGAGASLALLHGVFSISLKVDQIISGLSIWLLGLGLTTYFGVLYVGKSAPSISFKLGGFTPFLFIGLAMVIISWWILYRTRWGLSIRAVGENPVSADVSGINITRIRYVCVIVGGALAGLSGAYLSIVYAGFWTGNMVAGRGWVALALVFFSFWRPLLVLGGSALFSTIWVLSLTYQEAVPFLSTYTMRMFPYIATIVILVLLSLERFRIRLGSPASLGEPYLHEE